MQNKGHWQRSITRAFFSLIFIVALQTQAEDQNAQAGQNADIFVANLYQIYLQHGAPAAEEYLRKQAEAGLDLTPIRNIVLLNNENRPKRIVIDVHPKNASMLPWMNSQLRRSGIDFLELVPNFENPDVPDPVKPFREDATAYKRWEKWRLGIVPALSMLTVVAMAGAGDFASGFSAAADFSQGALNSLSPYAEGIMGGLSNLEKQKMIPAVVQGILILSIEACTTIWSAQLDKYLWSPERFQSPDPHSPEASWAKRKWTDSLRKLSLTLNATLERYPNLKAGYFYNYGFNYVYATAIFMAGWATAWVNGYAWDKSLWHFWLPNVIGTLGFYFAFGVNQTLIGILKARGIISEFRRLQIELTSLYFAKPGRILTGTDAGFWIGALMTAAVGALTTVPTMILFARLGPYADRTKKLFEENARRARETPADAIPVLERVHLADYSTSARSKRAGVWKCLTELSFLKSGARPNPLVTAL